MASEIKIYNLRIVPQNPVFEDVIKFKEQFINVFGKQKLSRSKPHITLAAFQMDSQYQDILIKTFSPLSSIEKFALDIQGFGIFKNNSNTLHLRVPKTKEIEQIHTQLKIIWIRALHRKQSTLKKCNTPHITISKTDGKKMLYESLAFFQEIDYYRRIEVNHLTLVSRSLRKTWGWESHIKLL